MKATFPMVRYESALWASGVQCIAGLDEAGRGALAGPLVSAAVVCQSRKGIEKLLRHKQCGLVRDSKTLSHAQRLDARELIFAHVDGFSVGIVWSDEIDAIGVSAANRIAMERALSGLDQTPECLLIDAMTIDSTINQWGIIDGDAQSLLISAASIVAKVHRDEIMAGMEALYTTYTFSRHRGYGTPQHLLELSRFGPCDIHRRSFEPVRAIVEMQL